MSHKKLQLKGKFNKENYAPCTSFTPIPTNEFFAAIIHKSTTDVIDLSKKRTQPVDVANSSAVKPSDRLTKRPVNEAKRFKDLTASEQNVPNKIRKAKCQIHDELRKLIGDKIITKNGDEMVMLGPNGTTLKTNQLSGINWASLSGPAATRKILVALFGHGVLATHTLSGKPSPAFLELNMPEKGQLNQGIVSDIIHFMAVTKNMKSKEVRTAITTKCADESKSLRRQREMENKGQEI